MAFSVTLDLDWPLLRMQKQCLLHFADRVADRSDAELLDGVIELIDFIQDEAAKQGEPVEWLTEEPDDEEEDVSPPS